MEKIISEVLTQEIANLRKELENIEDRAAEVRRVLDRLTELQQAQRLDAEETLRLAKDASAQAAAAMALAQSATEQASHIPAPQMQDEPEVEVELIVEDESQEEAEKDEVPEDGLVVDDEEATEELLTVEELQEEDEFEDKIVEAIEHPSDEKPHNVTLPSVDDIRKAISLGDRFLFQRELFGGDGEKMTKTINALNELTSLEAAMAYIEKRFNWDKESQAYELFDNILRRRFQ